MSSPHKNAWLAALSLVISVAVWEAEMSAEMGNPPAVEPDAPVANKDDAPASPPQQPVRHWLHWWRDAADERRSGNGCWPSSNEAHCAAADKAAAQPTPTPTPAAWDSVETELCPPVRRRTPHLVRRDFSWRWCSPP